MTGADGGATRLVPPGLVELAGWQRKQLPFAVRAGADAALCVAPLPAEGQAPGAPAVDSTHKAQLDGGRGGRHAPAAEAVEDAMFRSASMAARGLPSRRSSIMVGGSHERRAKVRRGVFCPNVHCCSPRR